MTSFDQETQQWHESDNVGSLRSGKVEGSLCPVSAPQHFLCLRPEPQAHRSLGFCFFDLELAPTAPPREATLVCFFTSASDAATIATLCSCSAAARRTFRNIRNSRSLWPNLGSSTDIGCRAFLLHPFWVTHHHGETDLSKGNV